MNRAADIMVGNWHVNGLLTLRTGVAYGLSGSCQGVWGRCEPDIVSGFEADQAPAGGRTPNQWFDINAYKVAAPLTGGNLGLQAHHRPAHQDAGLLHVQGFQHHRTLEVPVPQ